jgi:hypothetical protein
MNPPADPEKRPEGRSFLPSLGNRGEPALAGFFGFSWGIYPPARRRNGIFNLSNGKNECHFITARWDSQPVPAWIESVPSQLPVEGPGLQGGEEGVQLREVGAEAGFLGFDGLDDGGEAVLEVEWRVGNLKCRSLSGVNIKLDRSSTACSLKKKLSSFRCKQRI